MPVSWSCLAFQIPEQVDGGGDIFFIEPTLGAASSMSLALTDPSKIAAANQGSAVGDNRNMLSLIELRDAKTLKPAPKATQVCMAVRFRYCC